MKAGVSVSNAQYTIECSNSDCGLLDTVLNPQAAQKIAQEHQDWHKRQGDRTRRFSGRNAWTDAQRWAQS